MGEASLQRYGIGFQWRADLDNRLAARGGQAPITG
jgi:hypothetical protein